MIGGVGLRGQRSKFLLVLWLFAPRRREETAGRGWLPSRQRRGSDRETADRLTGRARVGSPSSFPLACTDTRGKAPNDKQRRGKDAQRYHWRRYLERPSRRPSPGRRRKPPFHQRHERAQGVSQMARGE